MNKDYLEYQYSKSKKLTERAFKLRIGMLMVSILACAAVMVSSAFAIFTCDIKRSTTLTAADFKVLEFNPIQMQSDEQNVTNVIHIVTTPGVLGYCKIPVYGTDNTTRYYYTEPFVGEIYFKIATAVGTGIGQPEAFWGNPRNVLAPKTELLGIGASVVHSYAAPQPEDSSGDSEGSGGMLTTARPSSQAPVSEDTPTTEDTTESTPGTEQETVTEEKTVGTTEKAEKSEITVTPSVSEEKSSVENNNSTVSEVPVVSTPPSGNSSDSGASNSSGANTTASDNGNSSVTSSSGNSSDSGSSSGSVSSGTEASIGGTTAPASDDGGE